MKALQIGIAEEMNGNNAFQLSLFDEPHPELICIKIKLKDIARHDQYAEVIKSIKGLMNVFIEIENDNKNRISISHLITRMDLPKRISGVTHVDVDMYKQTAKHLMSIEFNSKREPIMFTKYLFNIAVSATSKFTPKMYMLLCSWKKKRAFRITLDTLKYQLGLNKKTYPNYHDFKRFVLLPVQKDLENRADCWFDCQRKDFEIKSGRKVIALFFKILLPEMQKERKSKLDYVYHLLRNHAGFQDEHICALQSYLQNVDDTTVLLVKIQELITYCSDKANNVGNTAAYILQSLKNEDY